MILEMINMFPDNVWTVYSITEDDFIERERCIEELKGIGMGQKSLESLALHCHICPVSGSCSVVRDNNFLGVRTC